MAKTPVSTGLISGTIDINSLLAFVFGVVFLSAMIGFATWYPNPTPFQIRVYVTALALAAGGVGAVLPGRFDIKYKSFVRAGGALGLVALVYLSQPVIEQVSVRFIEPKAPAGPVVEDFLKALDSGNIQSAWDQLDPVARGFVVASVDQMKQLYDNSIKPLGPVVKRELVGTGSIDSPPGFPVGRYQTLSFRTKFAGSPNCRMEAVTLRATQDLKWRVFTNQISPMSVDC